MGEAINVEALRLKRDVWLGDGKPARKSYSMREMQLLVEENKRQPFTDGELLRIDGLKRIFNATVTAVIEGPPDVVIGPDVQEELTL